MCASGLRLATIFRARIAVITQEHLGARAVPLNAAVHQGACVTVLAVAIDGAKDAVTLVARFGSARIVIITMYG